MKIFILVLTVLILLPASAAAENNLPLNRYSLEGMALQVDETYIPGASFSSCGQTFDFNLGVPAALCLGGQLAAFFDRGETSGIESSFWAVPLFTYLSLQVGTKWLMLALSAGPGIMYTAHHELAETSHNIWGLMRVGAELTVWILTFGADFYQMDERFLVFRAGLVL